MASRVFTIPAVTVGTWQRVQIASDTVAILFKNDSKYDFLLYFGSSQQPNFTSSEGGQAHGYVNALEYPTVWIQAPGASQQERTLN